jgi:predicted nucleic acid-binding Zn ribbon protein
MSRPTPLADSLDGLLRQLPASVEAALRLEASWSAAVGADLAAHCHATGRTGDVIHVLADSEAWARSLRALSHRVLPPLRAGLGGPVSRLEVTVVPRAAPRPVPPAAPQRPAVRGPMPAAWRDIVDQTPDPETRAALRAMLEAYADAHHDR